MYTHLLLRYGEIFLKGKNRDIFVKKLHKNVRLITTHEVERLHTRGLMTYFKDHCKLCNVFGLVSYSPCLLVEKDIVQVKQAALQFIGDFSGTFSVKAQRTDKRFEFTSPQINAEVGKFIEANSSATFQFSEPEKIIYVEVSQKGVFVFEEKVGCFGGLPTGVEGSVLLLVDDEASLLAGLQFMKRGCNVFPVCFERKDISLLEKFSPYPLTLHQVSSLSDIEEYAKAKMIDVLVCGQTFDSYAKIDTSLVVYRPLVAYQKERVERELEGYRNGL